MSWIISHAISAVKSETPHQGRASLLDHRARRTCRVENDLPTFVRN